MASPRSAIAATTPHARRYEDASEQKETETSFSSFSLECFVFRASSFACVAFFFASRATRARHSASRLIASSNTRCASWSRAKAAARKVARSCLVLVSFDAFVFLVPSYAPYASSSSSKEKPTVSSSDASSSSTKDSKKRAYDPTRQVPTEPFAVPSSSNSTGSCSTSAASASAPRSSFSRHARASKRSRRAEASPSPSYPPSAASASRRRRRAAAASSRRERLRSIARFASSRGLGRCVFVATVDASERTETEGRRFKSAPARARRSSAEGRAGAHGAMRCAGVFPKSSTAVTSAPRLMSHLTTSSAPAAHARCMAVRPPSAASCASRPPRTDEGTRASMSSEGHFLNRRFSLRRSPRRAARRNRRVARWVRSSSSDEDEEEGIGPGVAAPNDREPRARRRVRRAHDTAGAYFREVREIFSSLSVPTCATEISARPGWRPRAARSRGSPARLPRASRASRLPARSRPRRRTARTRTR